MKARPRLTRARLRELLHYDRDTGVFRWWKHSGGDEVRLGEVAGYVQMAVDGRTYRRINWPGCTSPADGAVR